MKFAEVIKKIALAKKDARKACNQIAYYEFEQDVKKFTDKLVDLYAGNLALAMLPLDALHMVCFWYYDQFYSHNIPVFPIFVTIAVAFIGCIEIKSIYEKADEKDRKDISDVAALAHAVGKHYENIPELVAKVLTELETRTNDGKSKD